MEEKIFIENLDIKIDKKEILSFLEYDKKDIIFISGSIVEGIGNKYSDLDVYVIKDAFLDLNSRKIEYVSNKSKTQFEELSNGIVCDIEYWPLKTVETLISKIRNINIEDLSIRTREHLKIENYSMEELASFIHRFLNSYPIYNEKEYNSLKEQLHLDKFYKLMTRKYINNMDNVYEDVIGNMENNSTETMLISARNLLFELMNGYIFSEKYTIDRQKWIFEILDKISKNNETSKGILDECKKLYCYTNLNNRKDILKNTEDILNFSNKVLKVIEENLGGV